MLSEMVRRRWATGAGYLMLQGAAMYLLGGLFAQDWPRLDLSYLRKGQYAAGIVGAWAVVCVLQGLFLLPVRSPAPTGARGKSLAVSVAIVGFACAALLTGLLWSVADVLLLYSDRAVISDLEWGWLPFAALAVSWLAATPVLWVFARGKRREAFLGRVSARLFVGTVVEAVAIIPLDVMVRKKESCYCGTGTFLALLACGGVGVFALGPAILLPILGRRRKRWYAGRCEVCGYDMSGTPRAERCPECGAGWKPPPGGPAIRGSKPVADDEPLLN